jgi:hypothetical protein
VGTQNADVPALDPGFRRDDERTDNAISEKIASLFRGNDEWGLTRSFVQSRSAPAAADEVNRDDNSVRK